MNYLYVPETVGIGIPFKLEVSWSREITYYYLKYFCLYTYLITSRGEEGN